MKIKKTGLVIAIMCVVLTGCASSRSGKVYSRDQARRSQTIQMGIVELVHNVLIEGTKSSVGGLAGGAAGAALGSTIGSGTGKTVAAVFGAIAGGLAGSAAEEKVTQKDAFEITVKLDNGSTIVVVQEADEVFAVGDRVRILKDPDGTTRVRH